MNNDYFQSVLADDQMKNAESLGIARVANLDEHPEYAATYETSRHAALLQMGALGGIAGSVLAAAAVVVTQGMGAPLLFASGVGAVLGGSVGAGTEAFAGKAQLEGLKKGYSAGFDQGVRETILAAEQGNIRRTTENGRSDRVKLTASSASPIERG